MNYLVWANIVLAIHVPIIIVLFTFPIFMIFKKINAIGKLIWAWLVGLTMLSYAALGGCILTMLEQKLRYLYNPESTYYTGLISHYLNKIGIPVKDIQITWFFIVLLVIGILSFNKVNND